MCVYVCVCVCVFMDSCLFDVHEYSVRSKRVLVCANVSAFVLGYACGFRV